MEKFCQAGLFETISKFFSATDHEDLIAEISWILTNLSSTEDSNVVEHLWRKEFGLIQLLSFLIHSSNSRIQENGLWCWANFFSDKTEDQGRMEEILKIDIMAVVSELIENERLQMWILRVISWLLSGIWKYKFKSTELCQWLVENLSSLIFTIDNETITDAVYGFKHLTEVELQPEVEAEKFKWIAEAAIIKKLLTFLKPGDPLLAPAMRTIGNITSDSNPACELQITEGGFFLIGEFKSTIIPISSKLPNTKNRCWTTRVKYWREYEIRKFCGQHRTW